MSPPLKLGLIGYGFSTRHFHLPFITPNPELEVYAFLQRGERPSSAATAASSATASAERGSGSSHCTIDFPGAKHYRTADEFFGDSAIEVVIVTSHTDTHGVFAEKALRAGMHVVVEKPFTRTSDEADGLIALAKEKKLILTCFQNRRWDGDFLTLQHLIQHNAFGTIKEAEIHFDVDFPAWMSGWTEKKYTPGEGMTFGLGTHTIDQALLLFGPPASVTGFLRSLRGVDSEIDDSFTIILQYGGAQKDLLVTIKTSVITPMQEQLKYFVRGTEGAFVKHGTDPQEPQCISGLAATSPSFGVDPPHLYGLLSTKTPFDDKIQIFDEPSQKHVGRFPTLPGRYLGYYENLAAAVRGREEIAVKAEQSRDGLRVIELARKSSESGKTGPWAW